MARRNRLDTELVRRGLARSREQAADLVAAGRVETDPSLLLGRPKVVNRLPTVLRPNEAEFLAEAPVVAPARLSTSSRPAPLVHCPASSSTPG